MSKRPNLGFGDDDDQISAASTMDPLDLSSFKPQPVLRPDKQIIQEAAAKAQFRSREALAPVASVSTTQSGKATRRRRTGRSAQLNIKCRPETIEQFYTVADANGWGLGEAFEKAVMLLQSQTKSTI